MSHHWRQRFPWGPVLAVAVVLLVLPSWARAKQYSDAQISQFIKDPRNGVLIGEFLKYELRLVNEYATKPLLKRFPSLEFFINQAERGPLKNLFFLEAQVIKLRDVQKNINSPLYSLVFSDSEKKKIMSLVPAADEIVLYGIPKFKRDLFKLCVAIRRVAAIKGKDPRALLPNREFRDAVYRKAEPVPKKLDDELGELSHGEQVCFRVGWVLEGVRLTRLWLIFNDNWLPRPEAYKAFRVKRTEYWDKRMPEIYKGLGPWSSQPHRRAD
jgi:hypothetical protein